MAKIKVTFEVTSCSDCPNFKRVEYGFGGVEATFCRKTKKEIIGTDVIPSWCPYIKDTVDNQF